METIRFASTFDFEDYARRKLDKPTFDHFHSKLPDFYLQDFNRIKLRLRGMANLKYFKGIKTHVLLKPTASPIAIGPLHSDTNLITRHESMMQDVC
jgi:hypothetical protein